MHTDLPKADCEKVLAANYYAHLGIYDGKDPHVLPITYLYHNGSIFSFTREGNKIDIMRKHPNVCVQVEQVENGFTWQSVIVWGAFQEVTDPGEAQAMKVKLAQQFGKITIAERKIPVSPMISDMHNDQTGIDQSIIYRLKPVRMTGKAASIS
ncbi:MAG TPA: pyridoxamine 5'-phosphate oxidase family protein [Candidatus Peribacteria bacterium]|nr:pyridoxamine 5'-phosphate oxidase family protein [Candidatus Peribacteria bacterium]